MPYLDQLIEGYRRFRGENWEHERERWAELAEGQSPQVMILSCADSRADPAQIFDTRPGEMFVVRNIAGLAPPYETSPGFHGVSSALEFAVTQLNVGEILVMGHGLCGGCAAALTRQFDDSERFVLVAAVGSVQDAVSGGLECGADVGECVAGGSVQDGGENVGVRRRPSRRWRRGARRRGR